MTKQLTLSVYLICIFFGIQSEAEGQQSILPDTFGLTQVDNRSLHGTVNIILANRNGIVAVTDSRLSSTASKPNQPHYVGQKLFKLDEHTICTIAGSYSFQGVTLSGNESVGAVIASQIISRFSSNPRFASEPLLAKAQILSDALAYQWKVLRARLRLLS